MATSYIFSQIFVVIAYISFAFSYMAKKRLPIIVFNYGYLIFSSISFILLSAYIGLAMNIVAMVRNVLILIRNKDKSTKYTFIDYLILVVVLALSIVLSCFTYNGFFSLFSMFSTAVYSFSIWQKSIPLYKVLGILTSALFVVYNIFIWSIFGTICESIFLIFLIIENIRFFTKKEVTV